jgi:eukaryotic-like serine/threonine-protein kinase
MLRAPTASAEAGHAEQVQTGPCSWLVDGRYRPGAVVGRGGMADVFLAQDTRLDRAVALKLFRERTALFDVWERSHHEVCTVARLNHRNLVRVFDAGVHTDARAQSAPYLVMEFVDGPSLAQRISLGPLAPCEVAAIGAQIGAALCYVHARGIVHCDIKPANILLAGPETCWTAKLTDFGIAQASDARASRAVGVTVGTASYLSPEQVRNEPLSPASDVYSLGLVLLEALTGRRVYDGQPVDAAVARLRRAPEVPVELGTAWVALLTRMIATDPAARPSADMVTVRLQDIAADQTSEPMSLLESLFAAEADDPSEIGESVEPAPSERHRRRKGLIRAAYAALAPAAAVATVLLVADPFAGSRHTPQPATPVAAPANQARPTSPAPPPAPSPAARTVTGGGAAVRIAPLQRAARPTVATTPAATAPRRMLPVPASSSAGAPAIGPPKLPTPPHPPRPPARPAPPKKVPPHSVPPNKHGPGGHRADSGR